MNIVPVYLILSPPSEGLCIQVDDESKPVLHASLPDSIIL